MKMSFTYSIAMMRRCVNEKLLNLLQEAIHILLDKVLVQPPFHMKSNFSNSRHFFNIYLAWKRLLQVLSIR